MKKLNEYVTGDFLKAVNVDSEKEAFVVISVEDAKQNEKEVVRLTLENSGREFDFDLNKTNLIFLINSKIEHPQELIGRKLYFKKALVRNPKTNLEVEGLRISKVE